jgi:hypothetical protein
MSMWTMCMMREATIAVGCKENAAWDLFAINGLLDCCFEVRHSVGGTTLGYC